MTIVHRAARCVVGWELAQGRTTDVMQALLDRASQAQRYYSDDLSTCLALIYYPSRHQAVAGKSQTHSFKSVNADLRHYPARLGRRSRCFSCCPDASRRAIRLFIHCHNRRQLYKQRYPSCPAHLIDFLSP